MREHILVAVDAGGTRTRCAVGSSAGRLLGWGGGGPGNHVLDGWEVARASLAAAVGEALRSAGVQRVDAALLGSAGVGAGGEGREVAAGLLRELVPQAGSLDAVGDMVAGLWGALPGAVGVVVTSGTGSVALARNRAGDMRQVGGWGHLMGDEGSAYDIAVGALRAAARAADGRGRPTSLGEALARAAEVESLVEVALRLYGESWRRERVAALAAVVATAAGDGDEVAASILQAAGEALALAAVTALRVLAPEEAVISYTGSVFEAGEILSSAFAAAVRREAPRAQVRAPLLPPVGGVLRLAARAAGAGETMDLLDRWRALLSEVRP